MTYIILAPCIETFNIYSVLICNIIDSQFEYSWCCDSWRSRPSTFPLSRFLSSHTTKMHCKYSARSKENEKQGTASRPRYKQVGNSGNTQVPNLPAYTYNGLDVLYNTCRVTTVRFVTNLQIHKQYYHKKKKHHDVVYIIFYSILSPFFTLRFRKCDVATRVFDKTYRNNVYKSICTINDVINDTRIY